MSYKIYKNNNNYKFRYNNGNILINNSDIVQTTPTRTPTPSVTKTPTLTPSPTITTTATPTATITITPTVTPSPTISITPSISITPTTSVTPTVTVTPTISSTPNTTITPTNTITTTSTVTPTVTITPTPTQSQVITYFKTSNTANYNNCADWDNLDGNVTTVGSNGNPTSYGAYDMNGNSWEWTERLWNSGNRGVKGGSWNSADSRLLRTFEGIQDPNTSINQIGFRVASLASSPVFEYITVSDTNNSNDDSGIGSVSYEYKVNKFLITNNNYIEFLNSIASTDTYGVYNTSMSSARGGIERSGSNGSYTYNIKTNYGNKPVVYVSWYNAARYCNWLHNGKPSGSQNNSTTENGAYQLTGNTGSPSRTLTALYFLMNGDEWQKAAFYKGGSNNSGYWNYATQNDTLPTCIASDLIGNGTN